MSNPYAPHESPRFIWEEQATLDGGFLSLIAYGVTMTLYFQTVHALIRGPGAGKQLAWASIGYITFLFSLATVFIGMTTRALQLSFIDYRNFPGGPIGYNVSISAEPLSIIPNAAFIIANWAADGLLLFRCYIIFSEKKWPIIFPGILYMGDIGMGIVLLYQTSQPTAKLFKIHVVDFGLPYFVISASLNIILTLMICVRLLLYRRKSYPTVPGQQSPYASVALMLVESSAINAVTSILFIGPYAASSAVSNLFLPVLSQTQVIAPMLIILRVANRRSWTSTTMQGSGSGSGSRRHTKNGSGSLAISTNATRGTKRDTVQLEMGVTTPTVGRRGKFSPGFSASQSTFTDPDSPPLKRAANGGPNGW